MKMTYIYSILKSNNYKINFFRRRKRTHHYYPFLKPKYGRTFIPTQLPKMAIVNQTQPCRLPDAVPAKKAPILQPNAKRAPIPIIRPPIAAANS